jgi:hypothetical protein
MSQGRRWRGSPGGRRGAQGRLLGELAAALWYSKGGAVLAGVGRGEFGGGGPAGLGVKVGNDLSRKQRGSRGWGSIAGLFFFAKQHRRRRGMAGRFSQNTPPFSVAIRSRSGGSYRSFHSFHRWAGFHLIRFLITVSKKMRIQYSKKCEFKSRYYFTIQSDIYANSRNFIHMELPLI